jgi:Domain of unknown function (DUF6429)
MYNARIQLDDDKIDDASPALLSRGPHDGVRARKGFDWDAMHRLHEKGYISDPRGKAKSLILTEEGLERANAKPGQSRRGRASTR